MDFREFSKQYNDYLMHGLTIGERARGKEKHEQTTYDGTKLPKDLLPIYNLIQDPVLKERFRNDAGGHLSRNIEEMKEIANGGFNNSTKTRLIESILRDDGQWHKNYYKKNDTQRK